MNKIEVKMGARYVVLGFMMYLAYIVTGAEWLLAVKGADPMTINVIVGSIFGGLTMIIKSHFETKVGE